MPRYVFRMPISGTIEVTANGKDITDAVENYMAGTGSTDAEIDLDYIEDADRFETLGHYDDQGEFIEH